MFLPLQGHYLLFVVHRDARYRHRAVRSSLCIWIACLKPRSPPLQHAPLVHDPHVSHTRPHALTPTTPMACLFASGLARRQGPLTLATAPSDRPASATRPVTFLQLPAAFVLLASVKATSLLILGDPMGQIRSWALLLVSFDLIYWSLCGLLFGRVVED